MAGPASAQNRIFNGANAAAGDHPAQAVLFDTDGNEFCGGTVVAAQYILTAGHCVKEKGQPVSDPEEVLVGVGETSLAAMPYEEQYDVEGIEVYPGYQGGAEANDVAVLALAEPVPSSITPTPIAAPSTGNPWAGLSGTVFGWGSINNAGAGTDALQKLTYKVRSDAECAAGLGQNAGYQPASMLCAGDTAGYGQNANYAARRVICAGDSGGPLLVSVGGAAPAVTGVVSWSIGDKDCDNDNGNDVYARIGAPAINQWVREQIDPPVLIPPVVINNPGRRPTVDTSNVVARDLVKPTLGSLSVSNKTFVVDPKGAAEKPVASAKKGTTFRYRLSENARVVFLVEKVGKGRKSGKKCVKQTKGNRKKAKCDRYTKVGAFAQSGRAGSNSKTFSGRIGSKKLSPGKYRVTLTATDPARNKSKVSSVTLTVVRR